MKRLIFFLVLLNFILSAQTVKLVHADKHRSFRNKKGYIEKVLEGNVIVKRDTVEMYCDRAVMIKELSSLELIGNVRLITPSRKLNCKYAIYFENDDMGILKGNVVYFDQSQKLETGKARIYINDNRFVSDVPIALFRFDDQSRITADSGKAFLKSKRYVFTGNAHFFQPDSVESDLKIDADRFTMQDENGNNRVIAKGKVRFARGELNATCDSASFLYPDGSLYLYNDPRAYWGLNEMVGDTLVLVWDALERTPKFLQIRGQAEVFSPLDSLKNRENYLSGSEIIAKIRNNELDWIEARDNAISRYYIDNDDGRENGLNNASSDTIRLFLKNNEVDSVSIIGGIEGKFTPK